MNNFVMFGFETVQAVPIKVPFSNWLEAANYWQFTDQPRKY